METWTPIPGAIIAMHAEASEGIEAAAHACNKLPVLYNVSEWEGNFLAGTVTDEPPQLVPKMPQIRQRARGSSDTSIRFRRGNKKPSAHRQVCTLLGILPHNILLSFLVFEQYYATFFKLWFVIHHHPFLSHENTVQQKCDSAHTQRDQWSPHVRL